MDGRQRLGEQQYDRKSSILQSSQVHQQRYTSIVMYVESVAVT